MTKKTDSFLEKLARCYVSNCGDVPATMRECAPAIAEKGDAYLTKHFATTYGDVPQFWEFVEEYKTEVKKEIALTAADVMAVWTEQATLDCTEYTQVKLSPCPMCWKGSERVLVLPNFMCGNCQGLGVKFVDVTPTAQLSAIAKRSYRGAEQTKHGIKINHVDPDKAKLQIAKAIGMFGSDVNVSISKEAPQLPVDQNDASAAYANWIKE